MSEQDVSGKPVVNPNGYDWRIPFIKDLAQKCYEHGLSRLSRDFHYRVLQLFYVMAGEDDKKPSEEQLGYARAAKKYTDPKAQSQIVTLVMKHWPANDGSIFVNIPETRPTPSQAPERASAVHAPKVLPKRTQYDDPFQDVLSVSLTGDYDPEGTRKSLEDCLRSRFPNAGVSIKEFKTPSARTLDLLIEHRGYISEFCESLLDVSWLSMVWIKPFPEYGKPISLGKKSMAI